MNLYSFFEKTLSLHPEKNALEIGTNRWTYSQLADRVFFVGKQLSTHDNSPFIAILGSRSLAVYSGILGSVMAGKGYVPLNTAFPPKRTILMLEESGCKVVIVGLEGIPCLEKLLPNLTNSFTFVFPDDGAGDECDRLAQEYPSHTWKTVDYAISLENFSAVKTAPNGIAYLMFTSGSTGSPKGVPVSHENVVSYVQYMTKRYNITEKDRVSQFFDLTFDLSVHDLFVTWACGACLCVVPQADVMASGRFIRSKELTVWFSVPSALSFMSKFKMLQPDAFPTLRLSLFCGEPLPEILVIKWQQTAPNSIIENLYGPTEATIAITHYRWGEKNDHDLCLNGLVPIGSIFSTQQCAVVNEYGQAVETGATGELLLTGSHVTDGYLNNPTKTNSQYVTMPELGEGLWYRTGDVVRLTEDGVMQYVSRVDQQVKIRGYRVELSEVENIVRGLGIDFVAAVPWPVENGIAQGLVVVVNRLPLSVKKIFEAFERNLPDYMIPSEIHELHSFPLNVNGKIDRNKLFQIVEDKNG